MLRYLLALALSAAAFSQAPVSVQFRASAPFHAGASQLPAGIYNVRTIGTGGDTTVLHFEEVDGDAHANVIAARVALAGAEARRATSHIATSRDAEGMRVTSISFGTLPYAFELTPAK